MLLLPERQPGTGWPAAIQSLDAASRHRGDYGLHPGGCGRRDAVAPVGGNSGITVSDRPETAAGAKIMGR